MTDNNEWAKRRMSAWKSLPDPRIPWEQFKRTWEEPIDTEEPENICQQCDSPWFTLLGTLGKTTWIRCRDCGWDQQVSESLESMESDD